MFDDLYFCGTSDIGSSMCIFLQNKGQTLVRNTIPQKKGQTLNWNIIPQKKGQTLFDIPIK